MKAYTDRLSISNKKKNEFLTKLLRNMTIFIWFRTSCGLQYKHTIFTKIFSFKINIVKGRLTSTSARCTIDSNSDMNN